MSTEHNKALFRRLLDELNKGNVAVVDEVFAPDAVLRSPHLSAPAQGRQAFKDAFGTLALDALGIQYTLEEIVAEGDSVAARFTARGTHGGDFAGVPATGNRFVLEPVVLYRVAGGQIADYRLNWDTLDMMRQLGAAAT